MYNKMICSLVGAGGKSTLLYDIAYDHAVKGLKVLVTTSMPNFQYAPSKLKEHYARDLAEVKALWARNYYAVVGKLNPDQSISPLDTQEFSALSEEADIILIKADDSHQMPCKVPAENEPEIFEDSNIVIGVFGMRAFGRKLKKYCYHSELAAEHLHVTEDHILDCSDIVEILTSEWGTRKNVGNRKYIIILNQCNGAIEIKAAMNVALLLQEKGYTDVYLSHKGKAINENGEEISVELFFNDRFQILEEHK